MEIYYSICIFQLGKYYNNNSDFVTVDLFLVVLSLYEVSELLFHVFLAKNNPVWLTKMIRFIILSANCGSVMLYFHSRA